MAPRYIALTWFAHKVNPISPEDQRHTQEGGFRLPELDASIRALGCEPFMERSAFAHYLVTRFSQVFARGSGAFDLGRRDWTSTGSRLPWARLLRALIRTDRSLARFRVVRDNQIRLVWGFRR